jgi:membrane fusion protein, multidrug efflux system
MKEESPMLTTNDGPSRRASDLKYPAPLSPMLPERYRRWSIRFVIGAFALLVIFIIFKQVSLFRESRSRAAELRAGPRVRIITVEHSPTNRQLNVTGETRPYATATPYSKVSGYLGKVRADKGDHVEKGDVLAVIESPETNQDYEGAVADAKNKRSIANRIQPLLEQKLVSQQEADQAFSDAQIAEARLASIGAVKGYEEIRAPFSGTITARYADQGALVQNAANSQTSALPVFTISQVDRLRVYVYLDQKDAAFVQKGTPVQLSLSERPDVKIDATIDRLSGELDPKTRMLLAEVDIDNKAGVFVTGSFVQVALKVKSTSYLQVPVEAVVLKQGKLYVPVVTPNNTIT